jgi:hypothetical protein
LLPGIVTSVSPLDSRFITAVIAEYLGPLRRGGSGFIFGGILDQFDHGHRLAGIVLDLPEIKRGWMAVERDVAAEGGAIKDVFQFFLAHQRFFGERRPDIGKGVAVGTVDGEIDAETTLDAVNEVAVEGYADIDDADAFAFPHDRCHGVDAERTASRFDANDRFA